MIERVQIRKHGGPDVLRMIEAESKSPEADEIRIKVKSCGVNFADVMMRMGLYPEAPKPPFVPGYEVSGEVLETGASVEEFKTGDSVVALTHFGGYSSEVTVDQMQVMQKPEKLNFEEAAAIPVNFATAHFAVHEMARVRIGDHVLIQSAAGGVGIAAVQMVKRLGAHGVGLVGSKEKFDAVKEAGAEDVWLNSEWESQEPDNKSRKFDVILDCTGADGLKRSLASLSPMGRVVTYGVAGMVGGRKRSLLKTMNYLRKTPFFTPYQLMMQNKGVFGLNLLKLTEDPQRLRQALAHILLGFNEGHYRSWVGKSFPLSEAGAAHQHLQSRKNIGKVVLNS